MNPSNLTPVEKIEYSLGKDRLPNLHWKSEIPPSWYIPTRYKESKLCNPNMANSEIRLREGIVYKFNNLGYRSDFDYHVEALKTKNIILMLGDSDTMGRGVEYPDVYSCRISESCRDYLILNLGIVALSADAMARIAAQSISALGSAVKHVCALWPVHSNREFVSKKFLCGTNGIDSYVPYELWYDHIDWVSNNYNYQKNHLLLKLATQSVGAKYHELMINRYDKNSNISYQTVSSPATEYSKEFIFTEFTPDTHQAVANYFIRQINSCPSLYQEITQS